MASAKTRSTVFILLEWVFFPQRRVTNLFSPALLHSASREVRLLETRDMVKSNSALLSVLMRNLLDYLRVPGRYEDFMQNALRLMNGLDALFSHSRLDAYVVGVGPLFQVWFASQPIQNYRDAAKYASEELFTLWWREMLFRGVLFHPHYLENMFISMAHTDVEIGNTLQKAEDSIRAMEKKLGKQTNQISREYCKGGCSFTDSMESFLDSPSFSAVVFAESVYTER